MLAALMVLGAALLFQADTVGGKVTSADGMVMVTGEEQQTCGAVLSLVTELRGEMTGVLGKEVVDKEGLAKDYVMRNQLHIVLVGKPGDTVPKRLYFKQPRRVEGLEGYRIELLVHLARGFNKMEFEREVVDCLLLERGLRPGLKEGEKLAVPPWLIEGVMERIAIRSGEMDRGLYRALYERGLVLEVEGVLELDSTAELDAAQRTAFRVSSGALVHAMLDQPGGQESFGKLLAEIPTYEGEELDLIRRYFPETGLSEQSLAKWWALQLANLTQDFVTETLDILQSEEALGKVLEGNLDDEEGRIVTYRLEDFYQIKELEEEPKRILLAGMAERLGLFRMRCFPSYQPMVLEYLKILRELNEGAEENFTERLAVLREERQLLIGAGERARDYLDWYVINSARDLSGDFEDYIRLKKELETTRKKTASPLEEYMDGMQKFYDN